MKNNTTQIITINIKLQITIAAISPLLSRLLLERHVSGSSDVFRTLKDPNVSLEYVKHVIINENSSHPEEYSNCLNRRRN